MYIKIIALGTKLKNCFTYNITQVILGVSTLISQLSSLDDAEGKRPMTAQILCLMLQGLGFWHFIIDFRFNILQKQFLCNSTYFWWVCHSVFIFAKEEKNLLTLPGVIQWFGLCLAQGTDHGSPGPLKQNLLFWLTYRIMYLSCDLILSFKSFSYWWN